MYDKRSAMMCCFGSDRVFPSTGLKLRPRDLKSGALATRICGPSALFVKTVCILFLYVNIYH